VRAIELGDQPSLAHDEHPIAHAEHFGQFARNQEDCDALAREIMLEIAERQRAAARRETEQAPDLAPGSRGPKGLSLDNRIGRKESERRQRRNERIRYFA